MSTFVNSVEALIGETPLLRLDRLGEELNLKGKLFAKLEMFNPAGSAKDRPALFMIDDAEKKGLLKPGGTIIEPTSGNTGIALAAIAAHRGYKAVFTMPDNMSIERQLLLKAYGAKIVLTHGSEGMAGAIAAAEQIHAETPNSFIPSQFENGANALSHEATTGPEIERQCPGEIAALVAGVGSGGTITGTAHYLKPRHPGLYVLAVEPKNSPLLNGGKAGSHGLMGIGANFIPSVLDRTVIDGVYDAGEEEAYRFARMMGTKEGLPVGISAGAALAAAVHLAQQDEYKDKNIVVVLTDSGERYLSTPLYKD